MTLALNKGRYEIKERNQTKLFIWVPLLSILRMVRSILQKGLCKNLFLWRDYCHKVWFREVFLFFSFFLFPRCLMVSASILFVSSLFDGVCFHCFSFVVIWWCPLPLIFFRLCLMVSTSFVFLSSLFDGVRFYAFSFTFVWWCPLPLYTVNCIFFLWIFWCFFLFGSSVLSIVTLFFFFHYQHDAFLNPKFHPYILALYFYSLFPGF